MRLPSLMGLFGVFEGKKSEGEVGEAEARRDSRRSSRGSKDSKDSNGRESRAGRVGSKTLLPPIHPADGTQEQWPQVPLTMERMEATMQEIAECVRDWDEGGYSMIGNLQDAVRNHGRVDLMRTSEAEGGVQVAVKRMPNRWMRHGPTEFQEQYPTASEKPWYDLGIVRELNKLQFPYCCQLLDVFRDKENTYVATSLASEGDLFSWCDREPKPGLAREEVMKPIVGQIAHGVRWLHELGIAHRDLSLENILLTDVGSGKMHVKIIDFGMVTLSQKCKREVRGKQSYQAPEMHLEPKYDSYLTDVFAFGVVIFAMAAQDYPWTSTKRNECQLYEYVSLFGFRKFLEKRRLRKGNGEHLSEVLSPELVDVLDGLLESEAQERLTLGESCFASDSEHPSFWSMKWLQGLDKSEELIGYGRLAGG